MLPKHEQDDLFHYGVFLIFALVVTRFDATKNYILIVPKVRTYI